MFPLKESNATTPFRVLLYINLKKNWVFLHVILRYQYTLMFFFNYTHYLLAYLLSIFLIQLYYVNNEG